MSFLREFEDDVFISYAWLDDEPLIEGQKGWVTHFHRDLEKRVAQLLGTEIKIWRDDRELRGNDRFAPMIHKRFPKTGILVSVVSPRYLQSTWCMTELREFCSKAELTGGLYVQDKSRVFPVVKTPVAREVSPPEMQQILSYKFFELDDDGRPLEYNREFGKEAEYKYARRLNDVAYDIANFLRLLSGELRPVAPRATVYLAETTSDLREAREEMRRDLLQRGFAVLPDRELPVDGGEFKARVAEFLERADLSVHLVGERYGLIPEGELESRQALEAAAAAARGAARPGFVRIIWMPVRLEPREPRQQALVEFLHNDAAAQHGTELLESRLEDLKTYIDDAQAAAARRTAVRPAGRSERRGPLRVYVVADRQDLEAGAVSALEGYLFDQGFEVIVSLPGDDEARTREDHVEHLRLCDAALIYYGRAGELWLRAKLNDFRKVLDPRAEPVRARAVYVAGPETEHKRRFQTREALVLRGGETFAAGSLDPLLVLLAPPEPPGAAPR